MWNILALKEKEKLILKDSWKKRRWGFMKYKCGIFGIMLGVKWWF